jgi:heat shock protein HslJ
MFTPLSMPFSIAATLASIVILALAACSSTPKASEDVAMLRSGEWRLVTMQTAAVGDDPRVTLQFADGQKFSGRSFINQYFGTYTPGPNGAIEIGPVGMTRMAGPESLMQQENTYILLLGQVDRYEVSRETLVLMHGDRPLLAYGRVR